MRFLLFTLLLFPFTSSLGADFIDTKHYTYKLETSASLVRITSKKTLESTTVDTGICPLDMAIVDDKLFIANYVNASLTVISTLDHTVIARPTVPSPSQLYVHNNTLYVVSGQINLSVLSTKTYETVHTIDLGMRIHDVLFQDTIGYILCGNRMSTVIVLDLADYSTIRKIDDFFLENTSLGISLSPTHMMNGRKKLFPLFPSPSIYPVVHTKQSWADYLKLDLTVWKQAKTMFFPTGHKPVVADSSLDGVYDTYFSDRDMVMYSTFLTFIYKEKTDEAIVHLARLMANFPPDDPFLLALKFHLCDKPDIGPCMLNGLLWQYIPKNALDFTVLNTVEPNANKIINASYDPEHHITKIAERCLSGHVNKLHLNKSFKKGLESNDPFVRSLMYLAFSEGLWGAPQNQQLAQFYKEGCDETILHSYYGCKKVN